MYLPDSPPLSEFPVERPPGTGSGATSWSGYFPEGNRSFPGTRWSRVMRAQGEGPEAEQAMEDLCRAYWFPLYSFVRRCGRPPADAQDLTQGFFCEMAGSRPAGDHPGPAHLVVLSGLMSRLVFFRSKAPGFREFPVLTAG